jgi:hypothetical protein
VGANQGLITKGLPRWTGATSATLTGVQQVLNLGGTGDFTFVVTNASDRDVLTIDGVPYLFRLGLNTGPHSVNQILIGASTADTHDNVISAINAAPGLAGVTYGEHTKPHPTVTAEDGGGTVVDIIARAFGAPGNGLVITTDVASATVGNTAGGTAAAVFIVPEGAISCILSNDIAENINWGISTTGLDATGSISMRAGATNRLELAVTGGDKIYVFSSGAAVIAHATYFYG